MPKSRLNPTPNTQSLHLHLHLHLPIPLPIPLSLPLPCEKESTVPLTVLNDDAHSSDDTHGGVCVGKTVWLRGTGRYWRLGRSALCMSVLGVIDMPALCMSVLGVIDTPALCMSVLAGLGMPGRSISALCMPTRCIGTRCTM